ncbi:hypothetical protein [Neorickettsia sp. 179522]|uniref:hypothetical protein n=1 Tax=Neorickettsia sp. 179522 TaxID=1714371 RepID=UPI0007983BFF|nr:hypothetical protein [Neorickettsia sp. 179522]KYH12587.1 hypothetical protein AS219_02170 [Neorickettsia sp. 179522]
MVSDTVSSFFFLFPASVFFCICAFFFFKLNTFEKVSIILILIVCLFAFFQNNLFYILLSLETLSLIYSTLIASKGNVKGAVAYAACSFAVATAMAALIPHELSFTADNIDFFHVDDLRGKLFGILLFLYAVGFVMAPVMEGAYASAGPLFLPFFAIFTYTLPLALIGKLGVGHSEFLFVLSFFMLLYAFYRMAIERKLLNALIASQIGQVGLIGIILHCSMSGAYHYVYISAVYQLVMYFICSVFLKSGVDTFTKVTKSGFILPAPLFASASFIIISTSFISLLSSDFLFLQLSGYGAKIIVFFLQALFISMIPARLLYCCYATNNGRVDNKTFEASLGERLCTACICVYCFLSFATWLNNLVEFFVVLAVVLSTAVLYFFFLDKIGTSLLVLDALIRSGLLVLNRLILRMKKRLFFLWNFVLRGLYALFGSVIPIACGCLDSLSLSIVIFLMGIVVVLFLFAGV